MEVFKKSWKLPRKVKEETSMNLRRHTEELDMSQALTQDVADQAMQDFDSSLRAIWSSHLANNDEALRKEAASRQPLAQQFYDKLIA
jgi:hypothetical protein